MNSLAHDVGLCVGEKSVSRWRYRFSWIGSLTVSFVVHENGLAASGSPVKDTYAIRHFVSKNIPLIVCQSYSKIFGLYSKSDTIPPHCYSGDYDGFAKKGRCGCDSHCTVSRLVQSVAQKYSRSLCCSLPYFGQCTSSLHGIVSPSMFCTRQYHDLDIAPRYSCSCLWSIFVLCVYQGMHSERWTIQLWIVSRKNFSNDNIFSAFFTVKYRMGQNQMPLTQISGWGETFQDQCKDFDHLDISQEIHEWETSLKA